MLKNNFPLARKVAALLAVVLLLLWGLSRVSDVVEARQHYRWEAVRNVAASLAGPQTLLGPLLQRACVESWDVPAEGAAGATREERRELRLQAAPEQLRLHAAAIMDERSRGLHTVGTYTLQATLEADWRDLAALQPERSRPQSRLECGAPQLMLAVGDARGIRSAQLQLDGQALALKPGTFHPTYARGLHATLGERVLERRDAQAPLKARLQIELVGTERVAIVPLGGQTEVHMHSRWPHPSFGGRFLPAERRVGADGFEAQWRLSSLASTAQHDVQAGRPVCGDVPSADPPGAAVAALAMEAAGQARSGECTDAFSVAFVDPVNPYALTQRATRYGLLFIALTFTAVGLWELLRRLRVHPVQYLLVGGALTSFFLLLVSLSEHLDFALAYLLAAGACVLLLGYYASHILGSVRRGLPFGALMAALYGLLYLLLRLEQTALMAGALALFGALAIVMVATRRVDWYALGQPR